MMSDTTEIQQQQTIGNDAITEEQSSEQQVTMTPLQDKIPDTNANNDNGEQSLSPGSSTDRQDSEPPVHPLNTPISMARLPVLETKPSSSFSFVDQTDATVEEITVSDMEQDNDQDTQQVPGHDGTYSIPASQPGDTLINDISIKQEDSTLDTLMDDQPSYIGEEYDDDSKDALPPCDPELLKSIRETTSDDIWGPQTDDDLPTGMKITRDLFNEYTVDDSNESSLMHDQLFQLLINTTDLDDAIHQQADDIIQKYRQHNNDDDDISDHDDDMGSDDEDMLESDQDNMGSDDQEDMISGDNEDYENNDNYHNNEYNNNDENDQLLSD
ncbi:hypothetical protein K492DRAFT_240996 [Lichtheimia hyalospora FSU 10163]|nr:hypothetical protein K492DRAFT_240996 [Lichtheimia hyalospora FSU 10163]